MSTTSVHERVPRRVEILLATCVAVLGVLEVWVPFSSRQGHGSNASATIAVLLVATAVLWCRREPQVTAIAFPLVWGTTALVAPTYVLFYGAMVPLEIGVFMGARFGRGRVPVLVAGIAAASLLGIDLFVPVLQESGEIAFHWTVTALVWTAGYGLRTFERRAHESTRRAIEAEVGAAEQAMQAVLEERTRIARELHDIVAHSVSSMVVQAGAAEEAGPDDAEFVRSALASIRTTGNDALAEMRRLVSMLRVAEDAPLAPQPRLDALPALVDSTTANGLRVDLAISGDVRPLPAGLDLAVYRIVQEALTNVRRHSGARHCDVSVAYDADAIRVAVVDDGRGGSVDPATSGHGLLGMHERAVLYGGNLVAGPEPAGGFAVRAELPVAQ
ncbi:MAG TPA: sensor histidine kinase [Marmoricola sp.]|nr:sensor histidine kinase [Marmoricola sp.]